MTAKEQVASFPASSLNMYATCVVPTGKLLPDLCDTTTAGASPLSSVTVGSVHVTIVEVVPSGTL